MEHDDEAAIACDSQLLMDEPSITQSGVDAESATDDYLITSPTTPLSPSLPTGDSSTWVRRSTRKRKSLLDDDTLYSEERLYLQRQQQQQQHQRRKRSKTNNSSENGGGGGGSSSNSSNGSSNSSSSSSFMGGSGGYRSSDDEHMEDENFLRSKIYKLCDMIRHCKGSVCVFTGAGISRSAGLQTYRGKDGLWVSKKRLTSCKASIWFPTFTHRALSVMMQANMCQNIITQNCDSLHGITNESLNDRIVEIHGNCFKEMCIKCGSVFTRDFIISMPTSPTVYQDFLKKQKGEEDGDHETSKNSTKDNSASRSSGKGESIKSPRLNKNQKSSTSDKQTKQKKVTMVKKEKEEEKEQEEASYPVRRRRRRKVQNTPEKSQPSSSTITYVKSETEKNTVEEKPSIHDMQKNQPKIKLTENDEAHLTGRLCEKCDGKLRDVIVNFGESVPEEDWEKAVEFGQSCDITIVLGSSLKVAPTNQLAQQSDKLIICNLQRTALHEEADMVLKCSSDTLMLQLMKALELTVPDFVFSYPFHLCYEQPKRGPPKVYIKLVEGTTRNIFKSVNIQLSSNVTINLNRKNKFSVSLNDKLKKKATISVSGEVDKAMFSCKLRTPGSKKSETNNKIEFEMTADFGKLDAMEQKIECSLNATTYQWSVTLAE